MRACPSRRVRSTRMAVAALATVLGIAVAPAAPVPKSTQNPPLYYPTRVGATWVYQHEESGELTTERVTDVVEKNGAMIVTVSKVTDGARYAPRIYAVNRSGVYVLYAGTARFNPPVCDIMSPCKPGDKWDVVTGLAEIPPSFSSRRTVVAVERVEVPAGRFDAVRVAVSYHQDDRPGPPRYTCWFAAGVGVVKVASGDRTDRRSDKVLKSFNPGKD
jgi:hypothetical protein